MNLTTIIAVSGLVGAVAGTVGTLVAARYTWRKDKRETADDDREADAAADRAADRLVGLLKDANKIEIENERMKYELKLNDAISKLKQQHKHQLDEMRTSLVAEMQRQIEEAFDVYGCEAAATGCENRVARVRPAGSPSISI